MGKKTYTVALSGAELHYLAGSLSMAIADEHLVAFNASELQMLVRLHSRMNLAQSIDPEFVFCDGAVYSAYNRAQLVRQPSQLDLFVPVNHLATRAAECLVSRSPGGDDSVRCRDGHSV